MKISTQLTRPRHRALGTSACSSREDGYVLLTLLLIVSLLAIAFTYSIYYDKKFALAQQRRDREEELIHRGVQYSRAIRAYYKKFGRYPNAPGRPRQHQQPALPAQALQRSDYRQGFQAAALWRSGCDSGRQLWRWSDSRRKYRGTDEWFCSSGSGSSSAFGGSGFETPDLATRNQASAFRTSSSGGFSQSSSFGGNSNSAFGSSSSSQTSSSHSRERRLRRQERMPLSRLRRLRERPRAMPPPADNR